MSLPLPPAPPHTAPAASPPRRSATRKGGGNGVLWARGLLALLGGYAVAATWASALARLLPGSLADTALAATMASFVIYTLAAIWAYAARSSVRAAVGLAVVAALGGGLSLLLAGRAA
ncbi:iron transporter [Stenotrophomonas sp. VV52]|uniref:iron transporter n=1 Tax=Stenotrophomonas sp. VV52 TaxID=2066958 RepID=UPI0011AFB297|nr:iron transporter [Stenotrophomonas sp. VV52]